MWFCYVFLAMARTNLLLVSLLLIILLECSKRSNSAHISKHSQPLSPRKATISCPVFREVVKEDGAYDIVYWSICASRNCDDQHAKWTWIAGMNGKGETKVGREAVDITSEGALEILKVRLGDAGSYMCTVKRINFRSPRVHFATLVVIKDADSERQTKTTNKPYAKDCKEDRSKESHASASTVATCTVSALLVLAVGYIVYLKRSDLRCWNQRNSEARGGASDADVV